VVHFWHNQYVVTIRSTDRPHYYSVFLFCLSKVIWVGFECKVFHRSYDHPNF
jgi:hypothetical protein